jgi:hypothetical protein
MDPARMFKESLTSRPELENSQGHRRRSATEARTSALPQTPDLPMRCVNRRDGPPPDSCPRQNSIINFWSVYRVAPSASNIN